MPRETRDQIQEHAYNAGYSRGQHAIMEDLPAFREFIQETFDTNPEGEYAAQWIDRLAEGTAWQYADSNTRKQLIKFRLATEPTNPKG